MAKDKKKRDSFTKKVYEKELACLQTELVKMQEWVRSGGVRIVVIFEGRDAAGKGGMIKRITEKLSPALSGLPPCQLPLSARKHSGISSAMLPTCWPPEKLSSLTAAGTTVWVWSA